MGRDDGLREARKDGFKYGYKMGVQGMLGTLPNPPQPAGQVCLGLDTGNSQDLKLQSITEFPLSRNIYESKMET